jgi:hypothetical protein
LRAPQIEIGDKYIETISSIKPHWKAQDQQTIKYRIRPANGQLRVSKGLKMA